MKTYSEFIGNPRGLKAQIKADYADKVPAFGKAVFDAVCNRPEHKATRMAVMKLAVEDYCNKYFYQ